MIQIGFVIRLGAHLYNPILHDKNITKAHSYSQCATRERANDVQQRRAQNMLISQQTCSRHKDQLEPTRVQTVPETDLFVYLEIIKMHHRFGTNKNCALTPDHPPPPAHLPTTPSSSAKRLSIPPFGTLTAPDGQVWGGWSRCQPALSVVLVSLSGEKGDGCSSSPGIQGSLE